MADLAIQTRGLGKTYRAKAGDVAAVENLDLAVPPGEIFGLLGPNGAGKTTTVRMLCGLIRPTHGQAWVDGFSVVDDPNEVRRRIGLVPEDAGDHKGLTLAEELEYHGALYGVDRRTVEERSRPLLEQLGLQDRVRHQLKTFSKGMRRKFHLIRALLHEPRILLLDEPTAGLDPAVVEEVWDLLKSLAVQHQVTIILCSHHLEEVERLCTRVAILRRRLLAEGTLAELSGGHRRFRIVLDGPAESFVPALAGIDGIRQVTGDDRVLRFEIEGDARGILPHAVKRVVESGGGVVEMTHDGQDLRSLYRRITEANGQETAGGEA